MTEQKKRKKRGPKKQTYPYELAKQIVQIQGITTKADYFRWWNYNRPSRLPKRADIIYARESPNGKFSWVDFLGIKNKFPTRFNPVYRSYEDCKKFIYPLGIKNILEWFKYVKSENFPEDIPKAPYHYYAKNGEWISWKDFLGYNLATRHNYLMQTKKPMLYIAKIMNRPFNVFKIDSLLGEKEDLIEYAKIHKLQYVRCFYLNHPNDDWLSIISRYAKVYDMGEENEYFAPNIAEIISELSYSFETVT